MKREELELDAGERLQLSPKVEMMIAGIESRFRTLTPSDRSLLSGHLNGIPHKDLAALRGVTPRTIARWLRKIEDGIWKIPEVT